MVSRSSSTFNYAPNYLHRSLIIFILQFLLLVINFFIPDFILKQVSLSVAIIFAYFTIYTV